MSVQEYLKLPYNYIIKPIQDESGAYFHASVLELDGCQSTGDTFNEAYNSLMEAMEGWIETKLENGFSIPEPIEDDRVNDLALIPRVRNCSQITYTFDLPFCALAALPEPANTTSISGTWRLARTQNCCANCTSYLSTAPKQHRQYRFLSFIWPPAPISQRRAI